jgi:hypothetical protein
MTGEKVFMVIMFYLIVIQKIATELSLNKHNELVGSLFYLYGFQIKLLLNLLAELVQCLLQCGIIKFWNTG